MESLDPKFFGAHRDHEPARNSVVDLQGLANVFMERVSDRDIAQIGNLRHGLFSGPGCKVTGRTFSSP
jgi:hypothetical protein